MRSQAACRCPEMPTGTNIVIFFCSAAIADRSSSCAQEVSFANPDRFPTADLRAERGEGQVRAQGCRVSASRLMSADIVEAKTFKSHLCFGLGRWKQ